jgi:serine/threonine protein phosphatase 1
MNQPPSGNTRVYAIGDIHGRLDLLERAVAAIRRDVDEQGPDALTITLGDYVDRGPASRGVLDLLAANPFSTPYVALKGNHEAVFERFLATAEGGDHWRKFGGLETLHSYGIPVADIMMGRNFKIAAERLREALPDTHRVFLGSLQISHTLGSYFFCHAGVRPGVALEKQSDIDLLWIREEFLESTADFGKIVVHGHTPVDSPDVRPNRINIDTGAFASGRLTCIVLAESGHRFLEI